MLKLEFKKANRKDKDYMMNYDDDKYLDIDTYHELMDDSQYPCETVPPDETNFRNSTNRISEIYGQFIQKGQCSCIGCGYYMKSKFVEGYCCNPKSIWLLRRTGCKCGLKESKYLKKKHSHLGAQLKAATKVTM